MITRSQNNQPITRSQNDQPAKSSPAQTSNRNKEGSKRIWSP